MSFNDYDEEELKLPTVKLVLMHLSNPVDELS